MENKKSLLRLDRIQITPEIYVRIPTVGEVLDDEESYYSIISTLTASPRAYMVQLDDVGIDYSTIDDWDLFWRLFEGYKYKDMSLVFGDLDTSKFELYTNNVNGELVFYDKEHDITIDRLIYSQIADAIRKINLLEKEKRKPGNEEAKRYLIDRERKKQKRNANKPYDPYLEKLVIALSNKTEFKYNYEQCMDLSLYKFNQSFKQIQLVTAFDKTMIGVYSGTVDVSKMSDKSCLSWIPKM